MLKFFLLLIIFLAVTLHAEVLKPVETQNERELKRLIDSGDFYFKQKDYVNAFQTYKKALEYGQESAHLHYRLGRVYGFLDPFRQFSDKEYLLALHLVLKDYMDLDSVDVPKIKKALGAEENPIRFIKRDIDKDGNYEIFILMKRGSRSYVLFVLSSGNFYPKVTHLATFYRGDSGYEDIEFKDLNLDNKE